MLSSPARSQNRVEVWIVDLEQRAVGLVVAEPELLEDLESDRPVPDRLAQVGQRLLAPARAAGAIPVDVREHPEAVLISAGVDRVHLAFDHIRIGPAREVDQDAQVERVHLLDARRIVLEGGGVMRVHVNDRILGARDEVALGDDGRAGAIVEDARRRRGGRPAREVPRLSGPWRALLPLSDLHALTGAAAPLRDERRTGGKYGEGQIG